MVVLYASGWVGILQLTCFCVFCDRGADLPSLVKMRSFPCEMCNMCLATEIRRSAACVVLRISPDVRCRVIPVITAACLEAW
jgi:hypothetical protein